MQAILKELLDKLGVSYQLGPYETCPWSCFEEDKGRSCSAEVRMNPDGDELEAEIQILKDDPVEGVPLMEPIFFLRASPGNTEKWTIRMVMLKGEPIDDKIVRWQEKSCNFFRAVVQEIMMDQFPDIDALIEKEIHSKERGSDQYGGGGGKSPKVRGAQLMGAKKGGM